MNITKKSLILNILKKGPIDQHHPNYLVDVRILASGLLHVMMHAPDSARWSSANSSSAGYGSPAGTDRHSHSQGEGEDQAKQEVRNVLGGGKHVLVTLGAQGLLWVSSSGEAMGWDGKARVVARDIVELDDNTFSR
jgi:hypothetical protein